MKLVFFGSPAFAVPSLRALAGAGHEVGLVVSQPDRPAGRGRQTASPPVVLAARELGLQVWQTSTLKGSEAEARLRAVGADGMALAAFAAIVPRTILDLTPPGILNVHPSLLPRWRGASPIQSALLAGDAQTGVSIIRLTARMDAGPILLQRGGPIEPEDDYLTLEPLLAELGAQLLVQAFAGLADGSITPTDQDESLATYCGKIEREDARLDWSQPATALWNKVRAYRGWPQAYTLLQGQTLKVLKATPLDLPPIAGPGFLLRLPDGSAAGMCGAGALRLDEVVPAGGKPQPGAAFLRGRPTLIGARFDVDGGLS